MSSIRPLRWLVLPAMCAVVAACWFVPELSDFTIEAQAGPTASLIAHGRCTVPDGVRLLIHARGESVAGAFAETAVLTPVVGGRYEVDLGLGVPMSYRVTAMLAPRFNDADALPTKPFPMRAKGVIVTEDENGWALSRETVARVGEPADELQTVKRHVEIMATALAFLARQTASLRELEQGGDPAGLARWARLYAENRRPTVLDAPGIDPLYPALHDRLRTLDRTLQRRFHGVLATLTGAKDEVERAPAWDLVDRRLAQARRAVSELQERLDAAQGKKASSK